jgi:hypothetical protein
VPRYHLQAAAARRGLRILDSPPPPDDCIRRWPEPDPRPCSRCSSWSPRGRSRRPPPPPGRARAGRAAAACRPAGIWRRGASARRAAGAGGAAARRSTTCASGPPRRGASRARSSPATRPPAPRMPGSNAAAAEALASGSLHLTFAVAGLWLFSFLDRRFTIACLLLMYDCIGLVHYTVKSGRNPI